MSTGQISLDESLAMRRKESVRIFGSYRHCRDGSTLCPTGAATPDFGNYVRGTNSDGATIKMTWRQFFDNYREAP